MKPYPHDYTQALRNTPTEEEILTLLRKPARFVYGILKLPTVLKYYTDVALTVEIWRSMTQATLPGYKLYQFADGSPPVIAQSSDPQAAVEGMLIFDLDENQRNAIYELESGLLELVNVQVEICLKDCENVGSLRCVDAGAFAWLDSTSGLRDMGCSVWEVDEF